MLGRVVEERKRGGKDGERGEKKAVEPEGDKGKGIEGSDWGEEGWREAGIQVTRTENEPRRGGEAGEAAVLTTIKGVASGAKGGKEERKVQDTRNALEGPKPPVDPILANAPKGPRVLPRFNSLCDLCKVRGHSDLTCSLQRNAPTSGPSNYQKPYKMVHQRTPMRGLGATRGELREMGADSEKGGKQGRQGIVFEREKEAEKERGKKAGAEPEPEATGKEKGKQRESAGAGAEQKREEETGGGELLKIHLKGCRAPSTTTAKGREIEWKRTLRSKVEAALKRAEPGAQSSVLSMSYHFSRRNEKVVTVRVRNWTSKNEVKHIVLGAVKAMEQNWSIQCAIIADWVKVVIEEVDGREEGALALKRVEEIARANGWTLSQRAPQWIGLNLNFDTYEGSPTGLVITIIRRNEEPPAMDCVDSPYTVYGKRVNKKMKVFPLVRDGSHNFYTNEEGSKVSSRASEHGPYAPPQWSPYKGRNACRDCGDWRHRRCRQNRQLPLCNVCRVLHLDRECPRGVESREDLEKRRREVEKLRREKQDLEGKLRTIEEEMDTRYRKGAEQDLKKHHTSKKEAGKSDGNGKFKRGKTPPHTSNE